MIQTFFDSGVLIAAARSVGPDRERALQFLEDPNRSFLTSPFVHLEVVPKAIFYKKRIERSFYERYFGNAKWYRDVARIEAVAPAEATGAGLGAMDALHLGSSSPVSRRRVHDHREAAQGHLPFQDRQCRVSV